MRILSADIPAGFEGLQRVALSGLKEVVLLAGPNGGGKSRVLRAIADSATRQLTPAERADVQKGLQDYHSASESTRTEIHRLQKSPEAENEGIKIEIDRLTRQLSTYEAHERTRSEQLSNSSYITTDHPGIKPVVVNYNVVRLLLEDWKQIAPQEVTNRAKAITSSFDVGTMHSHGLSAVRDLINTYIYVTHQLYRDQRPAEEVAGIERRVANLKTLIRQFLNTELEWTTNGDPTIFGRPIAGAGLSNGQLVILQIALSLFFQDGTAENLVLLMDEPENHLHPAALINLIRSIRSTWPQAQIWIATHSVHLLAHFEPSAIWFVKDNVTERGGDKALEVLHSLLGGADEVSGLARFLALPAESAALRFTSQCLAQPHVADTAPGDPQTRHIAEILKNLAKQHRQLRVLDFGAGRGRLLTELVANKETPKLAEWLDYIAYDTSARTENSEQCKSRIKETYGTTDRYLTDAHSLVEQFGGSVHVIVLCNVLHEINPSEWLDLFGQAGLLSNLCSPDGHLLIVEDQLLKVGERAHPFGFLVLDSGELKQLFGIGSDEPGYLCEDCPDARYAKRLKAHLISGPLLKRASTKTRRSALELLTRSSLDAASLHYDGADAHSGRLYAFWTHQYMNATLACRHLDRADISTETNSSEQPSP